MFKYACTMLNAFIMPKIMPAEQYQLMMGHLASSLLPHIWTGWMIFTISFIQQGELPLPNYSTEHEDWAISKYRYIIPSPIFLLDWSGSITATGLDGGGGGGGGACVCEQTD